VDENWKTQNWGNTGGSNWSNIRITTTRVDLDHITFTVIIAYSSNIRFVVIITNISHVKVVIIGIDNNGSTIKCTIANKGIKITTIDYEHNRKSTFYSIRRIVYNINRLDCSTTRSASNFWPTRL